MPCQHVRVGNARAIVCGPRARRRRCCSCSVPVEPDSLRLCDWKVGKTKTCDKPICPNCSTSPVPEKDLCPAHAEAWAKHPKNPERECH